MQIYNYDPLTLEFLSSGLADSDPLNAGNWLIPADATTIEPLPTIKNKVSCFNKDTECWEYKSDYRGEIWYMLNGDQLTIEIIGQQPEESWTKEPPLPTIESLISNKRNEINVLFEQSMQQIANGYPANEVSSWAKQESEARAYIANHLAHTPLIDALASSRSVDKADLVGRIIAKADLFADISGTLIGRRQALEDTLDALPETATAEDVAAIVWL